MFSTLLPSYLAFFFFFDENLVYMAPLVVDPCFNTVETFEFAEEDELSVTLYH